MADAGVVTCVTCGDQYKICKSCEIAAHTFQSWKMSACCLEHWEISHAINDYFYGVITADEAKVILDKYGASKLAKATPVTQEYVEKIYAEASAKKRSTKKVEPEEKSE